MRIRPRSTWFPLLCRTNFTFPSHTEEANLIELLYVTLLGRTRILGLGSDGFTASFEGGLGKGTVG